LRACASRLRGKEASSGLWMPRDGHAAEGDIVPGGLRPSQDPGRGYGPSGGLKTEKKGAQGGARPRRVPSGPEVLVSATIEGYRKFVA
jgi:hypothetical protein